MAKSSARSARQRIRALLNKGATDIHAIAVKAGVDVQRAQEERSRWRKADYYRAKGADYAVVYYRRIHPNSIPLDEKRARARSRLDEIRPLLNKGYSWAQAANRLGITKGMIAGLVHREKRAGKHA